MESAAAFVLFLQAVAFALVLHVVPAQAGDLGATAVVSRDARHSPAAGRAALEKELPSLRGGGAYVVMTAETWSRIDDVLARSARLIHLQHIEIERLKRQAPRKECF